MFKEYFKILVRHYCSRQFPDSSYDAIIIGGGHNGLVAAAYLAKNGVRTCVLEKRHIVGGAAVTEEIIPGFKFSRASYLLSLLRPEIYEDLELKKFGLKYYLRNPSSYTPLRKSAWTSTAKSLTLGMDPQFNYKEISKFSEADAKQYFKFLEKLQEFADCIEPLMDVSPNTLKLLCEKDISTWTKLKIIRESKSVQNVLKGVLNLMSCFPFAYEVMCTPALGIMNKWFTVEPLKATILTDACIGTFQSPAVIGSSYILLHNVTGGVDQKKGAWAYVEGGMGALSTTIKKCATHHGAHIYTDQAVEKIQLDDLGNAIGVLTEDKNFIRSAVVLSNATPKITFLNLLPTEALDAKFKSQIQSTNYDSPVTKINVALNNILNFEADPNTSPGQLMPHHQCTIHLNCESVDDILSAHAEGSAGVFPKRPLMELTIPSSLDPTLCSSGKHVCLIFSQYTKYNLKNGREWNDETKKEYADLVFNCVEAYAPGFKDSIIGYEVLPPPELERIFGLTGGNIYHGEPSLDQLLFNRPVNWNPMSPYTPIKGLFLCGSGAHPGGGVTGSPGRLAALSVLDELKK
ncbi:hypothetical protein V9T40_009729 [Parthenolecanium corni]|uniref:FAD-dependent oxidoreductase n=1 Tax=Parthenolecanium corni TaxID=536013 RepID=A0AAN9U1D4_9HEMI